MIRTGFERGVFSGLDLPRQKRARLWAAVCLSWASMSQERIAALRLTGDFAVRMVKFRRQARLKH